MNYKLIVAALSPILLAGGAVSEASASCMANISNTERASAFPVDALSFSPSLIQASGAVEFAGAQLAASVTDSKGGTDPSKNMSMYEDIRGFQGITLSGVV